MNAFFWFILYIFTLFGSISFSYFLMRLLHPDSRALSITVKLKYSFFISVISFTIAAISSQFYGEVFLFVTFPVIVFLVYAVDYVIDIPKDAKSMKIMIPKSKRKR